MRTRAAASALFMGAKAQARAAQSTWQQPTGSARTTRSGYAETSFGFGGRCRGATGVHKRALEVEREHIGRLAGVDERLYGVQPGPLAHGHRTRPANPGPLVSAYDSFGGVTPIVFGYQAEASDGACDLIKALAEAWAPDLAERYVIDSAEAAVGVATDLLREEIGAAVFKAQATILLDRLRYCMPGH